MIRQYRLSLQVGCTTHYANVRARSHEEAYMQAIEQLHLKHAEVGNATVTPTLRTA